MTRRAFVHRLPTAGPDDVSALDAAVAHGRIDPDAIVAILGKTEGNGCVNDFSRVLAARAIGDWLTRRRRRPEAAAPCLVMSGGTEGGLVPHLLVFEVRETEEPAMEGALAIGHVVTGPLPAEDLGRRAQALAVASGVERAMAAAGIGSPADVALVQVKSPLLTADRIAEAAARGAPTATLDTLGSMGLSRGAAALGVGVALGELPADRITDRAIGADRALRCDRASASAGIELLGHEILVIGRGRDWAGPLRVAGAVMGDAIDIEPVRAALAGLGLGAGGQLGSSDRSRVVALIAKAEAAASGRLRGGRTTARDDSDISSTRHARAFTGGALAGLIGHAELFVSGGAEHQGPDGGGPVAVIVDVG